jgi:hypothetical protein
VNELRLQRTQPVSRPFDRKRLYKTSQVARVTRAQSQKGEVTVPRNDSAPNVGGDTGAVASAVPAHTEIQWRLLKLGSDMGLSVWAARNDKNREFQGRRFAAIPNYAKELPHQFVEAVQKTIELIDVLWLKKDTIVGAFEIESTTSIYSGLLRMSDLISMQPNLSIPLYIVAPDERRSKVMEEVNRPTFANLRVPMSRICRFIAFDVLKEEADRYQAVVRRLSPEWMWEDVAESCELDEA